MKQINLFIVFLLSFTVSLSAQTRYLEEVFTDVEVTSDVTYGQNITIITVPVTGMPSLQELKLDVYMPEGDTKTDRPLIIMFHSGNFLPHPDNLSTSGTRTDSTVVGFARRLAKMGYVVASASYRMGWNPIAPSQAERVNTLINAAYRGVQDARTCIRFFRKNQAEGGNTYGIDPDRIVLWGVGTGGYITLNTTVLDDYNKVLIPKFITQDNEGNPVPMVIQPLHGDPNATIQTPLCVPNHVGYSSDFNLSVNLGGAMGDTSWLDPGQVPMISFQVPTDPFAPYVEGLVIVPGLNLPVVEVQGSYLVQTLANQYGNNQVFVDANIDDAYTTAANAINDGLEGLYPFIRPAGSETDSAPWDWWAASNVNNNNGLATNPDMSFGKAMLFADTILGYFAPRAYVALDLASTSVKENRLQDHVLSVMPNPAHDYILLHAADEALIREVHVRDLTGQIVRSYRNVGNSYFSLNRNGLPSGFYFLDCRLDKGMVTKRVVFH